MDIDHSLETDFTNRVSLKDHVPASDQLAHLFAEGICHVLSHWVTLVVEVAEQIGVPFIDISEYITRSRGKIMSDKVKELAADIFIWFAQSKDERKVKSVGCLIQEIMRSRFKCSVGDGSTVLVSSKLRMLHQELVQGNLEAIEELRQSTSWIGQGTFDRLRKDEREVRHLLKRRPHLKMTKKQQPEKSSIVKDMKKTSKRHHPERLQLLLSALHISDC
ncbi:hypothetical protein MKX01_005232 [Papaver californicum]|nr:hypothetical protein MKX01_005232 [Papaver californicum]